MHTMAEDSIAPIAVMSSMMEWGLYDKLDTEERRCIRQMCKGLKQGTSMLIDTLVLPLDTATCSDLATAKSMARFHCSKPAAARLRVQLSRKPASTRRAASRFMIAYREQCAGGTLPGVTHCHVNALPGCQIQAAPMVSLLQALAALRQLTLTIQYSSAVNPRAAGKIRGALAGCKQLQTLAVDEGWVPCSGGLGASSATATQLRVLSMDDNVRCRDLAPLSRLHHLECMAVKSLTGPDEGMRLLTIRELRGLSTARQAVCRANGFGDVHDHPANTWNLACGSLWMQERLLLSQACSAWSSWPLAHGMHKIWSWYPQLCGDWQAVQRTGRWRCTVLMICWQWM